MNKDVKNSDLMHSPTVSIILPTHNRSEMLHRSIDSVLNQTYKDFELIVVSDGCTDNTFEIAASYADPRIRFLTHEYSRGASAARNTGIKASTGQYIAFLDDDDEWTPNKLEIQIPVIVKSGPEIGLIYAWMEYFQDGKSRGIHTPQLSGNVFVEMLDKQAIGGCPTVIIKQGVINKVGYFDESLPRGNDGDYWRRISKHYCVNYIPKVLAKVNLGHKDRISVDSRKSLMNVAFALEKRLKDFKVDFAKHPEQKAKVLAQVCVNSFKLRHLKKGFYFLWKSLKTGPSLRVKTYVVLLIFKSVMKHIIKTISYAK